MVGLEDFAFSSSYFELFNILIGGHSCHCFCLHFNHHISRFIEVEKDSFRTYLKRLQVLMLLVAMALLQYNCFHGPAIPFFI